MTCLCGDTECPSCGPAQGNWKCPICRRWATAGCDHVTEDGSAIRPEFQAEADRIAAAEGANDEAQDALTDAWAKQEVEGTEP